MRVFKFILFPTRKTSMDKNVKSVLFYSISILVSLLVGVFNVYSQKKKVENLPGFDHKIIHFGFTLGVNSTDFILKHDLTQVDSLLSLEAQKQSGFNLGIVSDLHMTPLLNLRFIPALSFAQRNLEYVFLNRKGEREFIMKPVESTFIEFPLDFKFRSERLNNIAAYMLGGFKYSIDLASQSHVDNSSNPPQDIVIKLKKNSYAYELGAGMDFFLHYFKFATELKLSMGLNNVFINDKTIFARPIESLKSKILLISFTFEG